MVCVMLPGNILNLNTGVLELLNTCVMELGYLRVSEHLNTFTISVKTRPNGTYQNS